jgi:HK97 family phage portal protein
MALGGEQMLSGERVNVTSSLSIADVFCAVSIITETVATLPLKVYRSVAGRVIPAEDTYRGTRMLELAPNPSSPAHRFWATAAGHLLLWGNCFVEKLRDENGLVSELWLLNPAYVEVQWNAQLRRKRFIYRPGDFANETTFDEDRVLHMFGFTTDGLVGLSPIQQTRQQLGLAKARERFEGEVYAQKPFLSGVIQHPGQIRDTVKLRESWKAIYGGGDKGPRAVSGRHSVAVLEEGASFVPLTAPLEDMQFVQSQQMSRETVANIFHLPISYLNGSAQGGLVYQTPEANRRQFATNAVSPVTVNMQKFLGFDRGIFPFSSWYPEFELEALMRGDTTARADFYKTLSEVKAILPDEIRALENMPPLTSSEKEELAPAVPAQLALNPGGEDAGAA